MSVYKDLANTLENLKEMVLQYSCTVLTSIIYMNLNVSQWDELRSISPPWTRLELVSRFWWGAGTPLRDVAELALQPLDPSPLIRSLLCGIICSNHFRLWDDSIFILREGIPMEQVLLQWFWPVQVHVVFLKDVLEQLRPLCEAFSKHNCSWVLRFCLQLLNFIY